MDPSNGNEPKPPAGQSSGAAKIGADSDKTAAGDGAIRRVAGMDTSLGQQKGGAVSWDGIGTAIAFIALLVSAITAYPQFWPSDQTKAVVSYVGWSLDSGRLGQGPELTLAISLVNTGNQPTILSNLVASYRLDHEPGGPQGCEITSGSSWIGFPWDSSFDGAEVQTAVPISILPKVATPLIYTFEPGTIVSTAESPDGRRIVFVCLETTTIDSNGEVIEVRQPLGELTFSDSRIETFDKVNSTPEAFIIVP